MDLLGQIGRIIGILATAGALLWGFLNYGWPRLARFAAAGWNGWLLRRTRERLEHSERQGLYYILDTCKDIVQRSETHKLWGQRDTALQLREVVQHRLRHRVRFFLLAESLDSERCISLLLEQNTIQPLFQFELGHVDGFQPGPVESDLCSIPSSLRPGPFIEQCEEVIAAAEMPERQPPPESPVRIVVTQAALPGNRYLWGRFEGPATWHEPPKEQWGRFEPNKFWVVSLALLEQTLPGIPAEQFLLRVMQRACVLAVLPARRDGLPDRLSHFSTLGCLFDYAVRLADAQHFVRRGFICEDCAGAILEAKEMPLGHRSGFLHALQKWIVDTREDKRRANSDPTSGS